MKRIIGLLGLIFCMSLGHAQNIDKKLLYDSLDRFRKSMYEDFANFRQQCLMEFAEFLRNPWKEFEESKPIPAPIEQPVPPVIIPEEDKDESVNDNPIVFDDVVRPLPTEPQPIPFEPIEEVPVVNEEVVDFSFFGTMARVRFDISNKPSLKGIDENNIADAFENFSDKSYNNMLIDCLDLRETLGLSDWAYLQMLRQLSIKIVGLLSNESTLLLAYLYMQSGYKMRLASDGNKLYMLYASKHQIYDKTYYTVDNDVYYGVEELPSRLYICNASFPKERSLSLLISTQQQFDYRKTVEREFVSHSYPDLKISVSANQNLLDFYSCYPSSMINNDFMTRWTMYANTPIEKELEIQLYPKLRDYLNGLSELDAVNRILNLIQTGFKYEYDENLWGKDRAFFSEESLSYPYCDCEDRSVLFTRIVRDVIGLKCVLIYYPGHLASAVEFSDDNIKGDYILLNGHKYIVADATYVGAPVGMTMPDMDNSIAKVILLE